MENISSCIQQTVGILAHLVNQQQTPYQQQYRPPFSPPSFNYQSVLQYEHPSQRNVQNENQGNEENECQGVPCKAENWHALSHEQYFSKYTYV